MNLINRYLSLVAPLLLALNVSAQNAKPYQLSLKSGVIFPRENLHEILANDAGTSRSAALDEEFYIIQFWQNPDETVRTKLKDAGINLLEYIPDHAFTAVVTGKFDGETMKSAGVRSVISLSAEQKVHPELLSGSLPQHAVKEPGTVDLYLSYPKSFDFEEVAKNLEEHKIQLVSDLLRPYEIVQIRIKQDGILALAGMPWVQYVEAIPAPSEPLNDKSAASTKANVLTSSRLLGYNLTGKGVVVGIGDYGSPFTHRDVSYRIISHDPTATFWHGVHVTGTVAGAGHVNERYQGYAPEASILFRINSSILEGAPASVRDFGMVITSNSHSPSGGAGCGNFGAYASESYVLDRQAFQLPSLEHVFAAGNSGLEPPCEGFPAGFGNVLGKYSPSKNVISVGRTFNDGTVAGPSSKGPVRDGRIKPELIAPGTAIFSTTPTDIYQAASGTSMAAPGVAGGLALLYERYRQLNGGNDPKNALIKALTLNGASDQGLAGPDFSYGFGSLNLLRSVTMLDKGHYFSGHVFHQEAKSHGIVVPPNTALLKVMLYWNDPAPSILSAGKTLVNDLDLNVTIAGSPVLLPIFPRAADPTIAAAAGIDSVNNVEQIVISNPTAGNYALNVKARKIPQEHQEYFVVYDIIEANTYLTYPIGSERLSKGDAINICWESYGHNSGTFSLSYSLNNGDSWVLINSAVPANNRLFTWTVPDATTGSAKIKIVHNESGTQHVSGAFTILGVPVVSFAPVQCPGYAAIRWTAVAGATDYEVMVLEGEKMKSITTINALNYTLTGLSSDSTYYITVRARKDGIPGRRAVAGKRKPDSGTCSGSISDNDLKLERIIAPVHSGRELTSTSLSSSQKISITVRNLDDQPVNQPLKIGFAVGDDGAQIYWETVQTTIAAQGSLDLTFNQTVNFAPPGNYRLRVLVQNPGDIVESNNVVIKTFRQIPNQPVALPVTELVEASPGQQITSHTIGIAGIENFDFSTPDNYARLRTQTKQVATYSGEKGFTLDSDSWGVYESRSNLDATYNLANFDTQNDEIRLSFRYRQHNTYYHSGQQGVLIRGRDTDPWVYAYEYGASQFEEVENGYRLGVIEISDLLKKNGQTFSSSFQIRWSQTAYYPAMTDGFTIDNIRIYKTTSDIGLVKVVPPVTSPCGPYHQPDFSIVLKNNSAETCYNVPVSISVDAGTAEYITVPVVRGNSDTTFTFQFLSTLHTEGMHSLKIQVEKAFDQNKENDLVQIAINTPAAVTSFPYLEDFEHGAGGWQSSGTNSSWQFGHPNSTKVKKAASGQNAWKTNLTGPYHTNETSYLYSPCFRLNAMSAPALSFSMSADLENCAGTNCDQVYIEYSVGAMWIRLGDVGSGTNWYNAQDNNFGIWNIENYTRWHVATIPLPFAYQNEFVQFRFVFKTNAANNREGIAIDDIHIYDLNQDIYNIENESDIANAGQSDGNGWIPLMKNGMILVAVNPHGQNMGNTSAVTYLHQGNVRDNAKQYYLDRSFIFNSSKKTFPNPVGLRLYLTDREIEKLIAAPEKANIDRPGSAYELAVTKYSGVNEDGTISNNAQSAWTFYPVSNVRKVPYGRGYYVEFNTKSFSEFWLAKDYIGTGTALPVELVSFSARKNTSTDGRDHVLLEWSTAAETDFSHFEVQLAVGDEAVRTNAFQPIGQLAGAGGSQITSGYSFPDYNISPGDKRYYRLKMVDKDSSERFSAIRFVHFSPVTEWRIFPNPSSGKFYLDTRSGAQEKVTVNTFDLNGKKILNNTFRPGTHEIDLSSRDIQPGLYFLKVNSPHKEQVFKVLKE
ncbi:S8 family serine peptidase [Dyadobacter aurulentus]|uniref:S8 family serine peptidase n=1 Tax=Dyadobacter sp. UC 10 TaxID=2605428 RepID=UPI0011F38C20|nr:S8 family serine peptidase [Dyadobacter sp. UC 10]KAA0992413.1 S8 family serine peptidase [Dyadobacter sp. UC 10]